MNRLLLVATVVLSCLFMSTSCFNRSNVDKPNQIFLYPEYSKGFYVNRSEADDSYLLVIRNPLDTTQIVSEIIIDGDDLKGNVKAACLSITHLAFCEKIGKLENMIGIPDSAHYIGTGILQHVEKESVKEITLGNGLKTEVLLSLKPDYLFTSEYQNIDFSTIDMAGIKAVPILEYLEPHPLGRMEWIRLFGFLMNETKLADKISETVAENYNSLVVNKMARIIRPTIFDVNEYHGYWYAAGGKSYMAQLYADAGFDYIWKDDEHNGSFPVSQEVALEKGASTEFWRFVANCSEDTEIDTKYICSLNEYYKTFDAVKKLNVIACNPSKTDYYVSGVLEPDVILMDLIKAREGEKDYDYVYYGLIKE